MDENDKVEDREEPGEEGVEATDEAPRARLDPVGSVVDLSGVSVPTVSQERRAVLALDVFWVLQDLVWQKWERLSDGLVTCHDFSERVLLAICRVEEVVGGKEQCVAERQVCCRPVVLSWLVVVEIEGALAVAERHARDVPEDQHEAELLVGHVPRWDNQLLPLGARVGVEVVGEGQEGSLWGDASVDLVLLEHDGKPQQEQNIPRQADLEEHLQVDDADSGVQWSTHEQVVDVVARHAVVVLGNKQRVHVKTNGEGEPIENGARHDLREVVEDVVELEDARPVHGEHEGQRRVERRIRVTEVWQLLVVEVL